MPHAFLFAARPASLPMWTCGKTCFNQRRLAARAISKMDQNAGLKAIGSGTLTVYRCAECRSWHIGHKRAGNEKREG